MTTPDLATLVADARSSKGLSVRDVADRSGGALSSTTVHEIEKGVRTHPGPTVLRGLAKGLGVPLRDVRAAAGHTGAVPAGRFVLPDRADELTAKERRLVVGLVDALLDARRGRR